MARSSIWSAQSTPTQDEGRQEENLKSRERKPSPEYPVKEIQFIEGDGSLTKIPQETVDQLQRYCDEQQTDDLIWSAKFHAGAQGRNFASGKRAVEFIDPNSEAKLDAARYCYGSGLEARQLVVVRSKHPGDPSSFNEGRPGIMLTSRGGRRQPPQPDKISTKWILWTPDGIDSRTFVWKSVEKDINTSKEPRIQTKTQMHRKPATQRQVPVAREAQPTDPDDEEVEEEEEVVDTETGIPDVSEAPHETPEQPATNQRTLPNNLTPEDARGSTASPSPQKPLKFKRSESSDCVVSHEFPVKRARKDDHTRPSFTSQNSKSDASYANVPTGKAAMKAEDGQMVMFTFMQSTDQSQPRRRSLLDCKTAKQFSSHVLVAGLVKENSGVLKVHINEDEPFLIVYNDERDYENMILRVKKLAATEEVYVTVTPVESGL